MAKKFLEIRQRRIEQHISNLYPEPASKTFLAETPLIRERRRPLSSAQMVMEGLAQHTDKISNRVHYAQSQRRIRQRIKNRSQTKIINRRDPSPKSDASASLA